MTVAIHIGYHKTATTWLQHRVFVPEMGFTPLLTHEEVDRLIVAPHDLDFDPAPAREALRWQGDGNPVVSSENLTGHPFFGGRQSATLARRLHQIAPDARIIVTVRSQEAMLPSVYMQYLQRGGTLSHPAFFAGSGGFGYPGFELAHFQYDRLIALYQSLFDTVHVMTHEQISADPTQALAELGAALGHDIPTLPPSGKTRVSASLPQAVAPLLRRINQTRRSTLNPVPALALSREPGWMYRALSFGAGRRLAKPLLTARPVDAYVKARLGGAFTDSNKRLDQITGGRLDLSRYP
ncbi:hypothetical protein [Litoreibacter arenae]|uniref:Sulfotransferase domain-containing protein n=1 Tax=Litoreibacter arenae DSM 19593 TaxID=1123360 RepID=S9QD63_9RHOB|nr:hypothetical protein [Litoreibacter arenae]EPX77518.1 hypothetical protein thalar_03242 [Litoreibacter arenae DSM 19593]